MHRKATDADRRFCGRAYCLRKILLVHEKVTELMEGTVDARKADRSWQNVPRMQNMLMEDLADSRKVDKSLQKVSLMHGKLTENFLEAWKVDVSLQKVQWMHGKMAEVDGRLCRCKESWRNVHSCMESWRKVLRRTDSWQKVADRPMTAQKVDWRWWNLPRSHGMLTESAENVQKLAEVDGRPHGRMECLLKMTQCSADTQILTGRPSVAWKVDGSLWNLPWRTESSWMVTRMHGKLAKGPADARKVDGRSQGRAKIWCKLTEVHGCTECLRKMTVGPDDARKFDGRTLGPWKFYEVKRKVQLLHKMFSTDRQNVDGSWRKFLWTNGELMKCLADRRKVDECWGKLCCYIDIKRIYPRKHRKLTKVYERSHRCTESWRNLKEGPADVWKIDR